MLVKLFKTADLQPNNLLINLTEKCYGCYKLDLKYMTRIKEHISVFKLQKI